MESDYIRGTGSICNHILEPVTWAVLIILVTLAVDLWTDYRRRNGQVNHIRGFWLRLIGFVPAVIVGGLYAPWLVFPYWAVFDGWMGLLLKQGWFYLGTTSRLDRVQRHYPVLVLIKYGLAVFGVIQIIKHW